MKTRLLILLSVLILFINLTWFFSPTVRTAPIPKDVAKQKPWSELLIGKWQLLSDNAGELEHGPDIGITVEFSSKGKVILVIKDLKRGVREYPETYTLIGNAIHFSRPKSDVADDMEWDVIIDVINETDLIIHKKDKARDSDRSTFKRIN